jgi:hypothetical protein
VDALRVFISNCIPNPASTENRFWSVTLYPQQGTLLRVNSGQQEVFTVFDADGDGYLVARPLASKWLNVKEFLEGPHYKTQSFAYFVDLSDFCRLVYRRAPRSDAGARFLAHETHNAIKQRKSLPTDS